MPKGQIEMPRDGDVNKTGAAEQLKQSDERGIINPTNQERYKEARKSAAKTG